MISLSNQIMHFLNKKEVLVYTNLSWATIQCVTTINVNTTISLIIVKAVNVS
jgi:hypothetical protein